MAGVVGGISMSPSNPIPSSVSSVPRVSTASTLPWLRQLRWAAVLGQAATVGVVNIWLQVELPLIPVIACIAFTALSNLLLHMVPPGRGESQACLAGILAVDVSLLTILLRLTGGPHNPFSSFYLAHVALAAVALSSRWTMALAFLCGFGYALLFQGRHLGHAGGGLGGVDGIPFGLHLKGMFIAFLLTAASIVFFAARLQNALRRRDLELADARSAAVQNEHFAALATLAAGAAHELGTPLGTIFLAAGEMAQAVRANPQMPELLDDAELIRAEAARCRAILDRLQHQAGDVPQRLPTDEVLGKLSARFPKGAIRFSAGTAPAHIFAPPEALGQALAALVKNALDATLAPSVIDVIVSDQGAHVEFSVIDQGNGLTPEVTLHAGEPFFTTKSPTEGMGLGLFLVKVLAQRLHGDFMLTPRMGAGAQASLRLPLPASLRANHADSHPG